MKNNLRLGLCCIFLSEPVKFKTIYANNLRKFNKSEILRQISSVCLWNSRNLFLALEAVKRLGIGAFRVNSKFFPLYTHPEMGYSIDKLDDSNQIIDILKKCKNYAITNNIRLSFHPDQFVILSSPRYEVVKNSINELEYHGIVAKLIGAELINIHIGGKYDSKEEAIKRFEKNFNLLSTNVKNLLTIENDDLIYTPSDVNKLANAIKIPFVYDVHHHRCNQDNLTEREATKLCVDSWNRYRDGQEPYFHLSSPKTPNSREHSDYINLDDLPKFWTKIKATVDIEAKAKDLAIKKLMNELYS